MPNETIHISLGPTANHISSHLLNLQGLAATRSGGNNHDDDAQESLCDPTVTHDISPVNDSIYGSSSSRQQQYVYVPRMLVVDGRNSFGDAWGAVGSSGGDNRQMANEQAVSCWNGPVSIWNAPHDESAIFGGQPILHQRQRDGVSSECIHEQQYHDPLVAFRTAASALGLSPAHSRYVASAPSYNHGMDSRYMAWDDDEREQEDEDDDVYGYDQDRMQEEKRRRMEKIESRNKQVRNELEESMANVWEQTFYADSRTSDGRMPPAIGGAMGQDSVGQQHADDADVTNNQVAEDGATASKAQEREIHWHDYLMPPRPSPSRYQIPLPFDTAFLDCNSFAMGYRPACGVSGDNDKNCGFGGVTQSWRESALSESLRKVLEGCDEVKGFNLFVDGGQGQCHTPPSSFTNGHGKSKHSKKIPNITAGGGLYAGLAASILEELHDECRSAGRWTVLVDPPTCNSAGDTDDPVHEFNQVQQFRRQLNAGLALHGLSANSDTFLPLSLEGAHRALFGERVASQNRLLFEGSAAIALALEASTLFYRLRRSPQRNASSMNGARSRLGIQSGFYRGFSGNSEYGTDNNNDPFASATSLTYHEFLACTKSSSDRRRSVLELDAMLRPLSYPLSDNAAAFGHGSGLPSNILASLLTTTSSGSSSSSRYLGQLHQRMMKGTSLEQMQLDQDRNFRSRKGTSARQTGPGEWLEDSCTGYIGGGGLLHSLSGHSSFGRRSDHHHFALSSALRPSSYESSAISTAASCTSAFIRPIMESMGAKYRPEVSVGVVVKDTVVDLTGVGSYWSSLFRRVHHQSTTQQSTTPSLRDIARRTPILSVLGNSTRSYPRLHAISTGFVDSLRSQKNKGYLTRDVMAGIVPEKDDCEEALEYCRELVDVYEPPLGSGLIDGVDENDLDDAYFDEH